ncbi:DUF1989 domain-containing protein [Aminobacter aminovorans]|uniref:Uncharacterized protein YcgI (DUF1989 family) n=1 Tax=Aminobacter aminovorans TaxID=83263 RepID=A0AAC8YP64_AMIAI|nr:urea carboxylase-associated family protein [Aminobacter aminovorans]AMS41958.1 hypothetical protein AA2016_3034 [Aminobacter aminovorans]MBB3706802.1 uncharacterized protein YcgI (DUF1989 family) [Aminobacter aminovorans]
MPDQKRVVIPAQSGRSIRVSSGDLVRIIDIKGQQVADLWAFTPDMKDWLSTSNTRDIGERLFPKTGEHFYGTTGNKLLTLVEDASPGPHDMLYPACNHALYVRAGFDEHPSCQDNLHKALASEGLALPFTPDPVDLFQNSLPQPDGSIDVFASINPPGGYVALRAECDLLLVVTACSVDHYPTNGGVCNEIAVEVTPAAWSAKQTR